MPPSLRTLNKLVGLWIVTGPLLLVAGVFFIFAYPPIVRALAAAALIIGGILLLGALVGKITALALAAIDERRHALVTDPVEQPTR